MVNSFSTGKPDKGDTCCKCGKHGHYGRNCHVSRITLPKAGGKELNAIEKYCSHCKKAGYSRENCWSVNNKKNKKYLMEKNKECVT